MKEKLKKILESQRFEGFIAGFVVGIVFYMGIRALHYWTHGTIYPMGY